MALGPCKAPCRQGDAVTLLLSLKGPSGAMGFAGAMGSITPACTGESSEEQKGSGQREEWE